MEKLDESDQKRLNYAVFSPGNDAAYQKWRAEKLENYEPDALIDAIRLRNLSQPGQSVLSAVISSCRKYNMAIYELENVENDDSEGGQRVLRAGLIAFCAQLGLHETEENRSQGDDGVVAIKIADGGIGAGYIPYTNKPLSWHTDGYYNAGHSRILAMVLHCVRDASAGGVNELLDPEIAYIRLRDESPAYVEALMHDEAMTIPENTDVRSAYRAPSVGPVFFLDEQTAALNMRYSARKRNIIWRDDEETRKACDMLGEILCDDEFVVRHKLKPGQGVISNNVLHNRTRFEENVPAGSARDKLAGRLLYRIRYKQRVALSA